MSYFRRVFANTLFGISKTAGRAARVSDYLAAGALRLSEMRGEIRQRWDVADDGASVAVGLMPWEEEIVQRVVQPGADVLLIGCGSGRDLIPLIERGCRVTGIDPAASPLKTAQRLLRERGLSAELLQGFFEDTPLSGSFDVVIFSYYAYGLIPQSRRRIGALRKAAAMLKPSGHVVISDPHRPARRPILSRLARVAGALSRSDWRVEDGDDLWIAGGGRLFYAHAFAPGEIEREAGEAGLRPAFQRDYDENSVIALARS